MTDASALYDSLRMIGEQTDEDMSEVAAEELSVVVSNDGAAA